MFLISIMISLFYLVLSIFINVNWIYDIACYFGYFVAIYLVTFIALIPGFVFIFTLISLLASVFLDISYGFIDPRIRMGAKNNG